MEQLIDLLRIDELDEVGVIYPAALMRKAVADFEERINLTEGVLGECSPPVGAQFDNSPDMRYMSIDMGRVSHIVRHVWIEQNWMKCKVKLLGQYAEIRNLMPVTFDGIARASGLVEGVPGELVCTAYTLITVDLSMKELK